MIVYVLNCHGKPLMPCKPQRARMLLKEDKAKVITKAPFTIKLSFGSTGYKQPVIAGMDTGSKFIGCAAIANDRVIYQAEVKLRVDVSKKMQQRAMYRRSRRGRKCRHRPARWLNRASMRKEGRLAPSIISKIDSHIRERKALESIVPVSKWKVETASFDIHKISNPKVSGKEYQLGKQKGFYNTKAYVLHRDGYRCLSGRKCKHSNKLHVHHIVFKSMGGTDTPSNLITLCETCHADLHSNVYQLKQKRSMTKHATDIGIIKSQLSKFWDFEAVFGYDTKYKREQLLCLPKTHYYDAVCICTEGANTLVQSNNVYYKRLVSKGDYQQTKGVRSEKRIPVAKIFGLRKHDLISTKQGTGFVKGKRSSGYFALENIFGELVHASANVKKETVRLSARTTTLIQSMGAAIPLGTKVPSILAEL
jgi:5-methylcytosine-specific restriction endonuclease McrA